MRSWFPWLASLIMSLVHLRAEQPSATPRFEAEIQRFEALDRRIPPPPRPILMVGSSSIRLWTNLPPTLQGRPVLNRGFGGSTFKDFLRYFSRVVLPYGPAVLVVYEGDNDLAEGKTPAEIAGDLGILLDRAGTELRDCNVLLLTVKPSPARIQLLGAQRQLNQQFKAMAAARKRVIVVDVASPLLDPQGQPDPRFFAADRLHLNSEGYEAWRKPVFEAIEAALRR